MGLLSKITLQLIIVDFYIEFMNIKVYVVQNGLKVVYPTMNIFEIAINSNLTTGI